MSGIPDVDESALPDPARDAGFIEIEPVTYAAPYEHDPGEVTSARARLFYNLIPADEDAKRKPVFVFFNGGPGAATTLLRSFGTGPLTLDPDDPAASPQPNSASFTDLGSLLYIDARLAGFSYGVVDHPESEPERAAAYTAKSSNAPFDAADFVRVLLRVLVRHPALRNNPVVIVGESYGGTRASLMLDYLLYPERLRGDGDSYLDAALADEIAEHARAVFLVDGEVPAARMARQFGWQVLLQPLVLGSLQARVTIALRETRLAELASSLGISADDISHRCLYDVTRSDQWCEQLESPVPTSEEGFRALVGIAPEDVPGLAGDGRSGAFRSIEEHPDEEPEHLGLSALPAWDRYYYPLTDHGLPPDAFTVALDSPYYVSSFLRAVRFTHTMISNGRYDAVIISESIVPALSLLGTMTTSPLIEEVGYVGADPSEVSSTIRLRLNESFYGGGESLIHFPRFEQSGHFIEVTEPQRLHDEVASFLTTTGL